MAKDPAAAQRTARLKLEKVGGLQVLNARVPRDITSKDFVRLGDEIIRIIKGQTGCTCLSGVIPVVFDTDFAEAIDVRLAE
jgi:hypothetical protein